jgi:bifunctional non-homologous end joining protein LigD
MECLSVTKLPEGDAWIWEIKLDGYRALAIKSRIGVTLFSRRRKSLNSQFPQIVEALVDLPEGTVVDGELVAIDDRGRPDFNLLQVSARRHREFTTASSICCAGRAAT